MTTSNYYIFEELMLNEGIDYIPEFPVKNLMPEPEKFKHRFRIDSVIKNDITKYLCVEIEGGIWSKGRHTRGKGYYNDILKYNSIIIAGYPLLRFPADIVKENPVTVVSLIKDYMETGVNTKYLSEFIERFKQK